MDSYKKFSLRNYMKGDEHGITSLFREVFEKEMTLEQWRWKYAVPGDGIIYSKVAVDTDNKIVGHAGAIPLRGVYKNKPIQIFQISDVMIHPRARGSLGRKSVFEHLMKNLFDDLQKAFSSVFCYGFPGKRPFLVGKRVRVYDEIEQAVDCILKTKPKYLNPFKIETINWNDKRIDNLFEGFSRNFHLSLIRDRAYLNWRYATSPFFSYVLLGIFLFGKLKGWVVVRDSGETVNVIDLLAEPNRYNTVFRTVGSYFFSKKKKIIQFWLPKRKREAVNGVIKQETEIVVTNMIWNLPMKTSIVRNELYYTMGDVDIF